MSPNTLHNKRGARAQPPPSSWRRLKNSFKRMFRKHWVPATRLLLLVTLLVAVGVLARSGIIAITGRWSAPGTAVDRFDPVSADATSIALQSVYKDTVSQLAKQSDTYVSWAGLILAAFIGIVMTTRVHHAPLLTWIYLFLAPAVGFLLAILYCGLVFQGRLTYLTVKNNFAAWDSLAELVTLESNYLKFAVLLLGGFSLWFLVSIVLGITDPRSTED